MNLITFIRSFVTYKEPKKKPVFELLEDEPQETNENSGKSKLSEDKQKPGTSALKQYTHFRRPVKLEGKNNDDPQPGQNDGKTVSKNIWVNLERIKHELNYPVNRDVIIRRFRIMQRSNAFIVYINGMADKSIINNNILKPLMAPAGHSGDPGNVPIELLTKSRLSVSQVTKETDYNQIVQGALNGMAALFTDNNPEALLIETIGFEKRSIGEPKEEVVINGPHEAFVEDLRTNITMVRRLVRNRNLISEILPAGKTDNLTCTVMYIKDIANESVIKEVKKRIADIQTDIISSGAIEQLIEDHPLSLFPQILSTERPDRTASFLLEGNVIILCDGSPYASITPATFFNMIHTSEDHTSRWQFGSYLRLVRITAAALAILAPGIYIALMLYHQEMIPSAFLVSLSISRENVPFPTFLEKFFMEFSWELIREAGMRVPGKLGQTLGIIGALILGQVAAMINLISPITIIIVSLTGLGNFAVPNTSLAFSARLLRFLFIFLGIIAGFLGIVAGIFIVSGYMCSIKSFGIPFFSPVAPKTKMSRDALIRWPTWLQKMRPDYMNTRDRTRSGEKNRGWAQPNKGNNL